MGKLCNKPAEIRVPDTRSQSEKHEVLRQLSEDEQHHSSAEAFHGLARRAPVYRYFCVSYRQTSKLSSCRQRSLEFGGFRHRSRGGWFAVWQSLGQDLCPISLMPQSAPAIAKWRRSSQWASEHFHERNNSVSRRKLDSSSDDIYFYSGAPRSAGNIGKTLLRMRGSQSLSFRTISLLASYSGSP